MSLPAPDIAILKSMELFAGLADAVLTDVLQAGHTRRLPKGTQVFHQGDPGVTCHSLIHGRVKITQTRPDGGQTVLRYVGPGQMYGTVAALMGTPFPADAVAVVDSLEIYWTIEAMRQLMGRHPEIAIRSTVAVGARVADLQGRIGELAAERVEQRIARAILRLVRQAGRRADNGVEIDFPITRQDLAALTGTTLHTVSRTLSAWEEAGVLESTRRHIVVRKPHALVAIAEDLP